MYNINRNEGGHVWEKQNLVTVFKNGKYYDILKCKDCGIVAKTTSLTAIELKGSYSSQKVYHCLGEYKRNAVRIKVTQCGANGKAFENLLPNSEHEVITPPDGYVNNHTGLWVMGIGEPVRLLPHEYVVIE